ncbi:MAG: hypothetical protein VX610_04400 [SAR324 cluster bacterium]|nr:hypothetical protein [SAR324 cluster bacterium]
MRKLIIGLIFVSLLGWTSSAHAQKLEVVFKSSLWGAGIGAAIGLASWALTDDQKADDLRSNLVRGAALGMLGGIAYGFWDAQSGGVALRKPPEPALLAYEARPHRLTLQAALPQVRSAPDGTPRWQWNVFRARF